MKRVAMLARMASVVGLGLTALAGCDDPGAGFPVSPAGGGPGGHGNESENPDAALLDDAAPGDADGDGGMTLLAGRACLVLDLRDLGQCASTGAGGLTVEIEGKTATTADNGDFSIETPLGTSSVWHVTGAGVVPSTMRRGPMAVIPVVSTARYATLVAEVGATQLAPGVGALVAVVLQNTARLPDVIVTSASAVDAAFYDGADADAWERDSTHAFGTAWLPTLAAGTDAVQLSQIAGVVYDTTVIIEDQAITYETIVLP